MDYRGRVVVVTGASSGIGRATAREFARRGSVVTAVARRKERLEGLARECAAESFSGEIDVLAGDLGEREFAHRAVEETGERRGRVDVLVNNAAIPMHKPLYETSVREAEEAIRINFFSCLWTTFAAIPWMLRSGGGTIVNVSSFGSKVVPPHETLYGASKCAMNGFSEGLWNDLAGSDIHVALIHPGPIDTGIWDKQHKPSGYRGVKYPPEIVVDAIFEAIEKRRHEMVVPRRNPSLVMARLLRLLWPRALRAGVARMDPIPREAVESARRRALEGRRLGE